MTLAFFLGFAAGIMFTTIVTVWLAWKIMWKLIEYYGDGIE